MAATVEHKEQPNITIVPGRCPWPECGREISLARLACGKHWARIPLELKNRVYGAYRRYCNGSLALAKLRAVQTEAVVAGMESSL